MDNIICEGACVVGVAALMNNRIKEFRGFNFYNYYW
jgi:hypothetical protein